jgi:hypothetical protein
MGGPRPDRGRSISVVGQKTEQEDSKSRDSIDDGRLRRLLQIVETGRRWFEAQQYWLALYTLAQVNNMQAIFSARVSITDCAIRGTSLEDQFNLWPLIKPAEGRKGQVPRRLPWDLKSFHKSRM